MSGFAGKKTNVENVVLSKRIHIIAIELSMGEYDILFSQGYTQQDGHQVVTIHYGAVAQKMMKGIHRTFASFAVAGNNIVVDYILYDPAWLADLVHVLKGLKMYFIGVNAPLSVIEEREQQRGNRLFGHARSHYDTVHKGLVYDLEIDSSLLTPEESALVIKKFIEEYPNPKAFNKNYGL